MINKYSMINWLIDGFAFFHRWDGKYTPCTGIVISLPNGPQKSFIALFLKYRREFISFPKMVLQADTTNVLIYRWMFIYHPLYRIIYKLIKPQLPDQSMSNILSCFPIYPPRNHHTFLSQSFSVLCSSLLTQLYHLFNSTLEP